jgi:excisionase family DNA binding protein
MPDILTTTECAERLRVSTRTIRQMITDGKIPHFRIGGQGRGQLRFDWEEVLTSLRDQDRSRVDLEAQDGD